MITNMIWKRITPVPPEFNGVGYLFECRKCGQVITYGGKHDYPQILCPNCERLRREKKHGL